MKVYKMDKAPRQYASGHTSKGNQWKWKADGYWYKADQFGYEGMAESVVTHILNKVNVPFRYVQYEPASISYDDRIWDGCRSEDFYERFPNIKGYELVPLEKLYRLHVGQSLAEHLGKISTVSDRIMHTAKFVKDVTGLYEFDDYLSFLIQTDAFFLNEDRHTNNIAVLWNPDTDKYEYCPYFDFGLSLFSDTREDYPIDMDYFACKKRIQAKPFSVDFDEQLDIAERISDKRFFVPVTVSEIRKSLEMFFEQFDIDNRIIKRITETVVYQASKYSYMIKS